MGSGEVRTLGRLQRLRSAVDERGVERRQREESKGTKPVRKDAAGPQMEAGRCRGDPARFKLVTSARFVVVRTGAVESETGTTGSLWPGRIGLPSDFTDVGCCAQGTETEEDEE